MKEEAKEVPRLNEKENKLFSFLLPGGRGGLQSVRLGTGGWFRPLPRGTRQARKRGKKGPKRGIFMGGVKRKVNEK